MVTEAIATVGLRRVSLGLALIGFAREKFAIFHIPAGEKLDGARAVVTSKPGTIMVTDEATAAALLEEQ